METGLYQKHRPKALAEMVGQDDAVRVVRGLLKGLRDNGNFPRALLLTGSSGTGKCLGAGTPVMRYDGTVVPVQDVAIGDLLIGPDSAPRRVLSVCRGYDKLYKVTPVKGDSYVVNSDHILSLKVHKEGGGHELVNIPVHAYLEKGVKFKMQAKGWRSAVDWEEREVPLPAYFVGIWLGDGTAGEVCVSKPDQEIRDYMSGMADKWGLTMKNKTKDNSKCPMWTIVQHRNGGKENPIMGRLRGVGLGGPDRHIPHIYKVNSREVRLDVLAGLLDTDGSPVCGGYDFISKSKRLADDVAFVARSLGLAAYVRQCSKGCQGGFVGTYYRVSISGDCSVIPVRIPRKKVAPRRQRKNVLHTGITVEEAGYGDYYGFVLDGDHLFLLGDFTVTHNTTLALILKERLGCHDNDFFALNCADFRGIDTARGIAQQVRMAALDQHRIWLLDEYHRATADAQEAMLKILEDAPRQAVFILATTDPGKLKKTTITRCTQIDLKPVSLPLLVDLVSEIAEREGVPVTGAVAERIASVAEGSPRKALVLLEAVINLPDEAAMLEAVQKSDVRNEAIELARALMKGAPWAQVSKILKGLDEDPEQLRHMVLGYAQAVMLGGGGDAARAYALISVFRYPFYDAKKPGLVAACWEVLHKK